MSTVKCFNTARGALLVNWQMLKSELSQAGGLGSLAPCPIFLLTQSQPRGAYYAHHITTCPPDFQTLKVILIPSHTYLDLL